MVRAVQDLVTPLEGRVIGLSESGRVVVEKWPMQLLLFLLELDQVR